MDDADGDDSSHGSMPPLIQPDRPPPLVVPHELLRELWIPRVMLDHDPGNNNNGSDDDDDDDGDSVPALRARAESQDEDDNVNDDSSSTGSMPDLLPRPRHPSSSSDEDDDDDDDSDDSSMPGLILRPSSGRSTSRADNDASLAGPSVPVGGNPPAPPVAVGTASLFGGGNSMRGLSVEDMFTDLLTREMSRRDEIGQLFAGLMDFGLRGAGYGTEPDDGWSDGAARDQDSLDGFLAAEHTVRVLEHGEELLPAVVQAGDKRKQDDTATEEDKEDAAAVKTEEAEEKEKEEDSKVPAVGEVFPRTEGDPTRYDDGAAATAAAVPRQNRRVMPYAARFGSDRRYGFRSRHGEANDNNEDDVSSGTDPEMPPLVPRGQIDLSSDDSDMPPPLIPRQQTDHSSDDDSLPPLVRRHVPMDSSSDSSDDDIPDLVHRFRDSGDDSSSFEDDDGGVNSSDSDTTDPDMPPLGTFFFVYTGSFPFVKTILPCCGCCCFDLTPRPLHSMFFHSTVRRGEDGYWSTSSDGTADNAPAPHGTYIDGVFHPAERTPLGVFPGQFRLPPNPDAEPVTEDGLPGLIRTDFWQMGLVVDGTEDDWPGAVTRSGVDIDPARRARFEVAERAVAAARAEAAAARPRADSDSTADSMPPLLYCGGDEANNNMDAEEEEDAEIELMN